MIKRVLMTSVIMIISTLFLTDIYAGSVAKIKRIEGKVSVLKKGSEKWRTAHVNTPLNVGDAVYSRKESLVEVVYNSGAILRMDENTKIIITEMTDKGLKTKTPLGNIWANMRKLVVSKKEFELESPTATAAIRGTVFQMNTKKDSSTDVSVYEGKVSVGPSKKEEVKKPAEPKGMHEVPGPEEIPGPYEVTLEQWRMIVAGQMISVNKEGKFSEKKFDREKASEDDFVKKNLEWDKELEKRLKKVRENIEKKESDIKKEDDDK